MLPRRVITPTKLIATRGPTVHSYYVTKPNGARLNTAGITRPRFDRPQTVMADGSFGAPLLRNERPCFSLQWRELVRMESI